MLYKAFWEVGCTSNSQYVCTSREFRTENRARAPCNNCIFLKPWGPFPQVVLDRSYNFSWYHAKPLAFILTSHAPANILPATSRNAATPSSCSEHHHASNLRPQPLNLGTNPRTRIHINPIRARPRRHPSRNPLTTKPMFLKNPHIPRTQPRTPQQHPSPNFESAVDRFDLCRCFRAAGREPVHAIHQDGDGEGFGLHVAEDGFKGVGVDAEVV